MKKKLTLIITCLLLTSCKEYSKEVIVEAKQMFPKGKIFKEMYGEALLVQDSTGLYYVRNSCSIINPKLNVIFTKLKEIK